MPKSTGDDNVIRIRNNENMISDLFSLLIWTSIILTASNSILAWKLEVTLTAIKALTLVLSVYGAAGLIYRLTRNPGVVSIVMVLYMGLTVLVGSQWLVLPLIIMSIVFCRMVFGGLKTNERPKSSVLFGSALATLLILGAEHYGNFLIMNKVLSGSIHKDTLYHASIASMIKNYHVVSTGLHGLVETPYHVLSHVVFAALSILAGISVLEAYGFFQIIFLSPLLVFTLSYVSTTLFAGYSDDKTGRIWLTICIFLLLAQWMLLPWAFWDSYFVSESYCLSLILLLLSLPILMQRILGIKQLAVASGLIILTGLAKGSVGIIGIELLWLRWFFLTEDTRKVKFLFPIVILNIIFYFIVINSAKSVSETVLIRPLSIIYSYSFWGTYLRETLLSIINGAALGITTVAKSFIAILTFFLMHFLLSWAAIYVGIKKGGWSACFYDPTIYFSLGASGLGIFIVILFSIPGGAAYYFTNVAFFISLPVVASWLVDRELLSYSSHRISICIMLITLFGLLATKEAFRKSFIMLKDDRLNDQFISNLVALRNESINKRVIFYNESSIDATCAGFSCSSLPFVYTAVSEHAWIGLIKVDSGCLYQYYNYPKYFTDKTNTKLITPVIPPEVKIVATKVKS